MTAIRAMAAEDLDQVLALERNTPEAPHWERIVYERLPFPEVSGVRYTAFVALDGESVSGFIVARQVLEVCEIESIVVSSSARGRGIGSALLDAIAKGGLAGGMERIQLEVRAGNESAIRFYERAGLAKEGLRRGYYREPEEDAVLMGKSLYSSD